MRIITGIPYLFLVIFVFSNCGNRDIETIEDNNNSKNKLNSTISEISKDTNIYCGKNKVFNQQKNISLKQNCNEYLNSRDSSYAMHDLNPDLYYYEVTKETSKSMDYHISFIANCGQKFLPKYLFDNDTMLVEICHETDKKGEWSEAECYCHYKLNLFLDTLPASRLVYIKIKNSELSDFESMFKFNQLFNKALKIVEKRNKRMNKFANNK